MAVVVEAVIPASRSCACLCRPPLNPLGLAVGLAVDLPVDRAVDLAADHAAGHLDNPARLCISAPCDTVALP